MRTLLSVGAAALALTLLATPAQAGTTPHSAPSIARDGADFAVWRPSTGTWFFDDHTGGSTQWGRSGDIPVPGRYDNFAVSDLAVWRPSNGTWYIHNRRTGVSTVKQWGRSGDIPAPGDFDGDGKDDLAVFRPSTGDWYWIGSKTGQHHVRRFGKDGDVPVPADYDGDGEDDLAVFRPSDGSWHLLESGTDDDVVAQLGQRGDVPVPGYWTSDRQAAVAVWRPSVGVWIILPPTGLPIPQAVVWGKPGDIPVRMDPWRDLRGPGSPPRVDHLIVFRPTTGNWLEDGGPATHFGTNGDVPVPGTYLD